MEAPGFAIRDADSEGGALELRLSGVLGLRDATRVWSALERLVAAPAPRVRIDLSGLDAIDAASAAILTEQCARLRARGTAVEMAGAHGSVRALLELHEPPATPASAAPPPRESPLEALGRLTEETALEIRAVLAFTGEVVVQGLAALRHPGTVRWRDLGLLVQRVGPDGLPVILVLSFLVGLVLAFQAAVQLRQFGASIFVADLVGIAMAREFGPLMTAVLVAGRSGAAFAAELGTMAVSEEVDALETLRLEPHRFLVIPRLLAVIVSLPVLVLVADAVGMAGGLVVGVTQLDLTAAAYLNQTRKAVSLTDVFSGVGKSVFLGVAIALVACERGLATRGGAEAVGRSTTAAVVATLFFLVVIDAAFVVAFHVYGI